MRKTERDGSWLFTRLALLEKGGRGGNSNTKESVTNPIMDF